jgi:RHS repeat-associated protein
MNWKSVLPPWRRSRLERPRPKRARTHLEFGRLEMRRLFALTNNGIVEYATTSPSSNPIGAVEGSDGNLWVTESGANELVALTPHGTVARMIPVSGSPYAITSDASGNLWATLDGANPAVVEYSTSGTQLASYPLTSGADPQGISVGPGNSIWFAEYGANALGGITSNGVVSYALGKAVRPEDVAAGPDGNLWVTDSATNQIARIGTNGLGLTSYTLPTKLATPWAITTGPDGNLWFTESAVGQIGRITTGGAITEFALPSKSASPKGIVTGPDGNLWFTESGTNVLGRISPEAPLASVTTLVLPTSSSTPLGIAVGPNNAIWLTESSVGQVATLAWLPSSSAITLNPVSSPLLDGDQRTSIPINPAPAGNSSLNTSSALLGNLSLAYNSDTVDVRPIIQTSFQTDPNSPLPMQIQVTLTWNGSAQSPVTFSTSGYSPGDAYLLSVQVANPVTATGSYPWSVDIQATLPGGPVINSTTSGTAFEVVNGPTDPIGQGWSLGGSAQLVSDGQGGYFWVNGNGGVSDFQAGNGSTFVSPPNNLGTLVQNGAGSFTYTSPDQVKSNFSTVSGQILLTSIVQPDGPSETFTYNASGAPVSVTQPGGWTATFTYDSNNQLATIAEPGNRTIAIAHDSFGNLISAALPGGGLYTYTYDSVGHMLSESFGNQLSTYTYDPTTGVLTDTNTGPGRTSTMVPASVQGLQTSPAQPASRQGTAVETDPLGRVTTYTYDSLGLPTQLQMPDGGVQTFQRDFAGQPTVSTDEVGRETTYTYQYGAGDGELTQVTNPDGGSIRYQYNPTFHEVTQETDPLGRVTTFVYNSQGDLTETIDPMGRTTTETWSNGLLQSMTDPLGRTTTYMYDSQGEVTEQVDPLGRVTTYTYDAAGSVTETIDPMGRATTSVYDAAGNVTETIDPMGRVTTTVYDADGEVTETIDPLSRITTTVYDADGEVIETIDPMSHATTTVYDADGEVTETIDPLGNVTTTLYDADGEMTEIIDPMSRVTTTVYDADGEVIETIDPSGNVTTTIYDADGEVTEPIDPLGRQTTTIYDADGEVTETIDPLDRATTSLYDADGRLVGQTWYDSHGDVTNLETYTYDADGNMLTAENDNGTYTMTYDSLNRVISVENPFGQTLNYTYDVDGNRTEVQDSLGGVTTYLYDADNEQTSEQFGGAGQTPLRIDLTYDADGELLTETHYSDLAGTQVVVESYYTYDADGKITNLMDVDGGGTTVADFTYTYDSDNRVTTEDNLGTTTIYTYDADGELISETSSLTKSNYSYDADGNQIGANIVIGPGNQLLSDGTWDYTYDADGNLIQKVGIVSGPENGITWTYTYDNNNQMTSAVEVQGSTTLADVTYDYDAFGNRIEEDVSGSSVTPSVTRFAYDGSNVWADLDGSDDLVTRRLFLNSVDSVTARISASGTVAWYLVDALGSVNALTDSTGAVNDRISYDAYGNILSETNPSASDRYLWTGREFDKVTGLQYNRTRYYDPRTGRWTTPDPIGFASGDTNLYRYEKDDPTNSRDPDGL